MGPAHQTELTPAALAAVAVMQSYSQIVDKSLSIDGLAGLGQRLRLPAGWTYRVRILDADSRLEVKGIARVINDEFENTYQLIAH